MESLARWKDQIKSLVYRMFLNEFDFHRLFKDILEVVLTFFSGVLHGKSAKCRPVLIKLCVTAEGLITRGMPNDMVGFRSKNNT